MPQRYYQVIHDRMHDEVLTALRRWESAYLHREGCAHCIDCPYLKTFKNIQAAYIGIHCNHPEADPELNMSTDCPLKNGDENESIRSTKDRKLANA